MGGGKDLVSEVNAQSQQQNRANSTTNATTNQKVPSPRSAHSSVPPLAPLGYLQKQRRGSITDPSSHAAGSNTNTANKNNVNTPRPAASYVFGDATTRNVEQSKPKMRKGRRSVSNNGSRPVSGTHEVKSKETDAMKVDERDQVDSSSQVPTGSKRKMSSGEEIVEMNVDADGPAAKRRGSTVDSQEIAQMSLYERWLKVGGGGGGGGGVAGKAEGTGASSSSMAFAWPTQGQHPEQMQNDVHHDSNVPSHLRPLDSNNPSPQLSMMSSIAFANDRRISVPDNLSPGEPSTGPSRALRSRSRPPSRQLRGADQTNASAPSSVDNMEESSSAPSPSAHKGSQRDSGVTPYSRSPELRVSHKLAERKRRKEMKELFDELRDQLPADRGMKASKWEILSKAIDFVVQLKQSHQDMAREIDMLRHELDGVRGGVPPFGPGGPPHPVVYGQPPLVPQQYPSSHPQSRPPSSQNAFPPGGGPAQQQQQQQQSQQSQQSPPAQNGNGNIHRTDAPQS